jgi:predicted amidohydrolase YtcJ
MMDRPNKILKGGNVITMDPSKPRCQAVAIRDEKIAGVGSDAEMEALVDQAAEVIELNGQTVVPGFIDPHQHLFSYGITMKTWVDLSETYSSQDILERLAKRIGDFPEGRWILGRGWSEESLQESRLPTRWELDEIAPANPVAFKDISGHYCIANSLALKLGDVTKDTPQPEHGRIDKDPETDEPNGILRESGMNYVWNTAPPPTWDEILEAVKMGARHANKLGITSVHTVGIPLPQGLGYTAEELGAYGELRQKGELTVRTYLLIPICKHVHRAEDTIMLDHLMGLGLQTGFGDSILKIGAAKIFVDGSLNARSAALYDPYEDDPSSSGMMFYSQEELNAVVEKAHRAGMQIAIHAHGDRAIDVTLNAYEKVLREIPRDNHRHRIKHIELLTDDQIERIKKLDLVATCIASSAGFSPWFQEMARKRVGKRRVKFLHRYKDLLDAGVTVAGGTDGHPVGRYLSPLQGLRDRVVVAGFSLEQAFRIETMNSAFASFEDNIKGSIEKGKLADMVVLAEDPYDVDIERLPDIRVRKTIVGGKIVYEERS